MSDSCSIDNFTIISVIGKGAYAKVFLVRYNKNNQLYALKALKKKYIIEKHQEEHIMTQKSILAELNHPFLVKLKFSFQDQRKLYFILEYCPGGELFNLLAAKDKLIEEQAMFYAAQTVLVLEQLHKHKIIYREYNLKPQNIIIDKLGYIKLTDFGLSKILSKNETVANTICGTPEYLAPQIIKKLGHGVEVDWWCLGCLIHEMVTGFPPFHNDNRLQLYDAIVNKSLNLGPVHISILQFSSNLQNLLKKLLEKDFRKRLGYNGSSEIKKHPWFKNIDWQQLLAQKIKAPFVPKLSSDVDTKNFDVLFTNGSINSQSKSPPIEVGNQFVNFSFENDK